MCPSPVNTTADPLPRLISTLATCGVNVLATSLTVRE
jgi:hypothetical protein